MNFEDTEGSPPSTTTNIRSQSRTDRGFKGTIPSFSHHLADLSKKSLPSNILTKSSKNQDSNNTRCISQVNTNSLTNISGSPKNEKRMRPYHHHHREVAPKILNISHDADLPNPGAETEGNTSVIRNNHSLNEIRIMTLPVFEEGDVNPSPASRTRRNLENDDSSRLYFFNQSSTNQINGPPNRNFVMAQDLHQSQPIILENTGEPNQLQPDNTLQNKSAPEATPEITQAEAGDWQHDLTVKANHKFRVTQWSLIFIVLASLMGYASLSGETPPNVLYIILLLNNILQTYSVLRFFNKKILKSKKGLNKILKLCDWLLLTIFSFGSLLKIQNENSILLFYLTPIPVSILLRIVFIRKKTSLLRILLWLQVIVFTLKVDNILNLSWFIAFIIAFGFCLGFIIRLFYLFYRLKNKKDLSRDLTEENHIRLIRLKMLGIGWDIFLNSYCLIFILFFFGLAQKLQTGENSHILDATLILAMIYSIFLIYLTLKYKYEITRSIITKIIRNDNDHIKIKKLLQKELEIGISTKETPKQLIKVSPTYYQVAESEVKTRTDKGETKSKTTFITVGDLMAHGKEEEKEPENNEENAEELDIQEDEENNQEEEEEEEEEEEKVDEQSQSIRSRKDAPSKKFKFLFRRKKKARPSFSEADAPQDEEEAADSRCKSEEDVEEDPNCFVCCDKLANTVIMNCGHGGICYQCGLEMWKKEEKCYLCRQKISRLLRLNKNHEYTDTPGVQLATTLNKNVKLTINQSFQDILNDI